MLHKYLYESNDFQTVQRLWHQWLPLLCGCQNAKRMTSTDLRVSCKELSLDKEIDLKNPSMASTQYLVISAGRGEVRELSPPFSVSASPIDL